jgi:signal peptidase I
MALVKSFTRGLVEFFELVFIGTAVALIVFIFIAQLSRVDGDSMLPTLESDERVIVEKLTYKFRQPERGDIIVAQNPENKQVLVIKRIIGLPGERIQISGGKVIIDGVEISESYLGSDVMTNGKQMIKNDEEFYIPLDKYVVMGDNRTRSTDSRDWGTLSKDLILGKGFIIYWPFNKVRLL